MQLNAFWNINTKKMFPIFFKQHEVPGIKYFCLIATDLLAIKLAKAELIFFRKLVPFDF